MKLKRRIMVENENGSCGYISEIPINGTVWVVDKKAWWACEMSVDDLTFDSQKKIYKLMERARKGTHD